MGQRRGLIDSNVLVASAGSDHVHHAASAALLGHCELKEYATARHCLAEFYNVATRRYVPSADPLPPERAIDVLNAFVDALEVLDIDEHQHLNALRNFGEVGGVGARVYDYLIGRVAVAHAIPLIVTWNVKHFEPLFPTLRIATPTAILEES